jgi:hypothetical protein
MVNIQAKSNKIQVQTPTYGWCWDVETDILLISDAQERVISTSKHQPQIHPSDFQDAKSTFEIREGSARITYHSTKNASSLIVTWYFHPDFISLQPLEYQPAIAPSISQIFYFPSFYSHYAVVPGLSMSASLSPIVDLQSNLSVNTVLGAGAMRGTGFTQQWGLPAHYFCVFNTAKRWNAIGAKKLQSGAACWGLAEIPQGDFRLQIQNISLSPILNVRSDLWNHIPFNEKIIIGFHFFITFGENYHEAIRNYYKILQREKVIAPKSFSQKKRDVLLAPQYNTWGVECAKAMQPEDLTEELVEDIYKTFRASGMRAKTFVIDDKWEGAYGELSHHEVRFPNFENLLKKIRNDGFYIGLWAAFLRCQNPNRLGLNESHLLQTHAGEPLWLQHQTAKYGIFDLTQPEVQKVLSMRVKEFMRRYQPDLIKFDFGYELPSLDVAAPYDKNWAGERLLQKSLEVIVGAMKTENPDLVIMYYGLSPLLIESYDLHSPDDLVYCIGDYDLETNRRVFFSSLCGELGLPTYSSSGYEWASATDIWFDCIASGSLGSLHCFEGDENGDLPTKQQIAIFNGLCAIARKNPIFQTYPIYAKWQGGLRSGFAPAWERMENNQTVLLALRLHGLDGKPLPVMYKSVLQTNVQVVIASMNDIDIAQTDHLGIVPFGVGKCVLQHDGLETKAKIVRHVWGGAKIENEIVCKNNSLEIDFHESDQELEWVEVFLK